MCTPDERTCWSGCLSTWRIPLPLSRRFGLRSTPARRISGRNAAPWQWAGLHGTRVARPPLRAQRDRQDRRRALMTLGYTPVPHAGGGSEEAAGRQFEASRPKRQAQNSHLGRGQGASMGIQYKSRANRIRRNPMPHKGLPQVLTPPLTECTGAMTPDSAGMMPLRRLCAIS